MKALKAAATNKNKYYRAKYKKNLPPPSENKFKRPPAVYDNPDPIERAMKYIGGQ